MIKNKNECNLLLHGNAGHFIHGIISHKEKYDMFNAIIANNLPDEYYNIIIKLDYSMDYHCPMIYRI